jgi:hypothetical protein
VASGQCFVHRETHFRRLNEFTLYELNVILLPHQNISGCYLYIIYKFQVQSIDALLLNCKVSQDELGFMAYLDIAESK